MLHFRFEVQEKKEAQGVNSVQKLPPRLGPSPNQRNEFTPRVVPSTNGLQHGSSRPPAVTDLRETEKEDSKRYIVLEGVQCNGNSITTINASEQTASRGNDCGVKRPLQCLESLTKTVGDNAPEFEAANVLLTLDKDNVQRLPKLKPKPERDDETVTEQREKIEAKQIKRPEVQPSAKGSQDLVSELFHMIIFPCYSLVKS